MIIVTLGMFVTQYAVHSTCYVLRGACFRVYLCTCIRVSVCTSGLRQRQADRKNRPLPKLTADANSTTVRRHNLLRNRQPQSCAVTRPRSVFLEKAVENVRQ